MSANYRLSHELGGKDKFFTYYAPVITGVGASVVIIGALFKIMHWPGSSFFLIAGLGTEALIFFMFAFQPPAAEPDWTIVYPELAAHEEDEEEGSHEVATTGNTVKKLDDMMASAGINQGLIERLGTGISKLAVTAEGMSDISDATAATSEYTANVSKATSSLVELNKAYSTTVTAMSSMADASSDTSEYHSQVQTITKNLAALNSVYEMELQDANSHLKAMNKFYSNLSTAMNNLSDATKDSEEFKNSLTALTKNITSLNSIYGNMIAAMKA